MYQLLWYFRMRYETASNRIEELEQEKGSLFYRRKDSQNEKAVQMRQKRVKVTAGDPVLDGQWSSDRPGNFFQFNPLYHHEPVVALQVWRVLNFKGCGDKQHTDHKVISLKTLQRTGYPG